MNDLRIQRWAEVLVQYSVAVKPGETVAIQGGIAAEPLLRAVYREVLKAGGVPSVLPVLPGLQRDFYELGSDQQLETITAVERFMRAEADVTIQIMAERNTRALTGIDPARLNMTAPDCATGAEVAQRIKLGEADCGIATRSVAHSAGLGFVPLVWENFDLVLRQRDYFLPGAFELFGFLRTERFRARAAELGGYDLSLSGSVRLVN